ncbi:AMP-binding protein [Sphingobium sp. SA2]|jgi:acyl-CoA synthetase (AMP-forming)/AMP-acid ligase II|nr:AMP-binding protein [Sphingobium sp. SA2]MDT7532570.1 AMP-binding protein [Sphingobium sp. SA2]
MTDQPLSIVAGPPLSEEPGLGALTLSGWLREVTTRSGPAEALVMYEGDSVTRWTYDDLWTRANAVARALIACGVGKGTRVGILMTNRPEFLAAAFGTALAGGVAATLSTFSTPAELDHLLQSSACHVLLMERTVLKKDFAAILTDLEPGISTASPGALASPYFPFLRHIASLGGGEGMIEPWDRFLTRGDSIDQALIDATAATVTPADPGVLFFSSGSTAKPKGILSMHRGVTLQLWRWKRFLAAKEDARAWSANGFFWSGNFAMAIGGALSSGGSLILQATFQPEEALTLMARERATMAFAWPHQWAQLEGAANWSDVDLSALHYVGQHTPLGRHPTVSTDWQEPMAAYGNTETFTISTIFDSGTPDDRIAGTHGIPLPGNIFKILDPLTGAVVPLGQRGEIAVKGPTLMLGYIGVPLDESVDADGFFHTGDGGWFDAEGRLHWEGRLNDIIKTGGANVSPIEIDTVIKSCPGVKVTQTVGVPHETLGELVVTCIVPHVGAPLDEDAIRTYAKAQLASYKVPRRVLFFSEDDLSLTGSAKIKTADLKALVVKQLSTEPA